MSTNSERLIEIGSDLCKIDGRKYPPVAFGTYPLEDEICFNAVSSAANCGYRIFDTATCYENFGPIGEALKKYERRNFYIISKVWPNSQSYNLLLKDAEETLRQLQVNYLDAYLLHWPNHKIPIEESLNAMKQLKDSCVIRHIGVSNFTINHLKRALECNISIDWLQVEMNALFYDDKLIEFCHQNNIAIQAWAPLANGKVNQDSVLRSLAQKYNKASTQIAIRWIIQNGCLPLPQSSNPDHILKNFEVLDFSLSQDEMHLINEKAKHGMRTRFTKDMDLGFTDEFDFSYEECWPKK